MTFNDCLLECLEHKELIKEFDRLANTKVMQIFYDTRPPIVRMIDETTGYEKVIHAELEKDLMNFIWFVYDCIWMRLPENCRDLI